MTMNNVAEVSLQYSAELDGNAVPAGYKQTEAGVIPSDWEVRLLEQLVAYRNGAAHENCIDDSGDYVVVNSKFISTEGLTRKGSKECRQPAYQSEILMVMSDVPNGRAIAKCYWVESNDIYTVNQRICALKCTDIESRFLFYKLNRNPFYLAFDDGAKQTNLRRQDVLDCPIPVPTKQEQTAIANALSDVDALISELEKLIAKKQAIKTATMQQLLTGRTRLPQFALREDGTQKGTKHSELGEIPEDWAVKTYGEVFTFLSTSTNSRADLSEDGDFGYVHYGDIHTEWNNKLDLNKERLPRISKSIVSSAFVMDGDLIMADASEDYEGIGKTVEVFNVGEKQIVAGLHTFLLRDKEKVLADGFRGYLHSIPAVKSSFDRLATGMKVYGISKNNLSSVFIPVPSLEEQTAIATILSDMDAEIQALEQRLGKTRQIKQGMMQELLTGRTRLPFEKEQ